ncbi:Tn3 family transposase, partial [Moritella sp.]|uniref:Tn3 family transposase n=1 Tax=Moritella sp. TaxID=78556 RepID=UPI0025F3E801
ICWNYLYLRKQIENEDNPEKKQEIMDAIKNGSVVTWQHINLHGEYDFSDGKLLDSIGLSLTKDFSEMVA